MKKIIIAGFLIFLSADLKAQEAGPADSTAVKTIDGILQEVLSLTSRKKGSALDEDAFRNLFLPTARFTVLNHDDTFPVPSETVTLEEFIELMRDPYYEEGYTEYELGKVVDEYNGIASVFQSVYQKDSENFESRAVNSYQLIYFNDRWWIANLIWTSESDGIEIPKKYLEN